MGMLQHGQVVAAFGRHFDVETAEGIVSCVTRGKKSDFACGDRLEIELTGSTRASSSICRAAPALFRSDEFRTNSGGQRHADRHRAGGLSQPLRGAAQPLPDRGGGRRLRPLIVLNKADLPETPAALARLQLYRDLGYPCCRFRQAGRNTVTPLVQGQTSVLVGQSGMGKSTLVNTLLPDLNIRTRKFRRCWTAASTPPRPRACTTWTGQPPIDSPGVQEFGLNHLGLDAMEHAFIEFRPYLGNCRFNNCRHLKEPGCAVLEAATAGKIDRRRLGTFHKLVR